MKNVAPLRSLSARLAFCLAMALLLACTVLLSLRLGAVRVTFAQLWEAIFGKGGDSLERQILLNVRLPRILTGAAVGACLAVSGAILQGVMRNPLAAPGIIGVSSGAGLAGTLVLLVCPQYGALFIPIAFLGAMGTAMLVYLLAWRQGASPIRIVLAGVAISALLGAVGKAILLYHSEQAGSILNFTIGSLSTRSWPQIRQVAGYMTLGLVAAISWSGRLNVLSLGDEVAAGLGLAVERTRLALLAVAALLAASAVSVAGLLGFVGLMAPHIVRLCIGADNRSLIPGSALFGAWLVVACDTAGRTAHPPAELPVGVLLALLGAPFFLWLLRRRDYGT
ncbi:MAG: iron ABC transporter permease [Victivallales bacterium]|nr:iron ABC transporter permease [Victivallales bacterium]